MPSIKNDTLWGLAAVPFKALRAKKIIISWLFLLIAGAVYVLITNLAMSLNPGGSQFDVFPGFPRLSAPLSQIVFYLGAAISVFILMIGMTAVTIVDFEEMRGDRFFSTISAIKFARRRIKQLFLSEMSIVLFVAFIILLGILVGLLTRIPYLGELLYSIFFVFPNFVVAIFTVLVIYVLTASILVMPPAVAAERNGETFNSILAVFSTVLRRPIHWFIFTAYSGACAKIGGFIFAYFTYRALQFIKLSTWLGGGEKITNLIGSGLDRLPYDSHFVAYTTNIFPGLRFGFDLSRLAGYGDIGWTGYLMSISMLLIFLLIWGYMISVIATGQAYIFAYIRKIRGGSDLSSEPSIQQQ